MFGKATSFATLCVHGSRDACNCAVSTTGTEQSLDELEFSRSACSAAQDGDVAKLRRILSRNTDAIRGDGASGGYTPLHYAARGGHLEAVELLLRSGADPNAATRGMGATPLHRAAMQGHVRVVECLLAGGANVAAVDCDLQTPLHKAAEQGHEKVCQLLLDHFPKAAGLEDKAGKTPLQLATGAAVGVLSAPSLKPGGPPGKSFR